VLWKKSLDLLWWPAEAEVGLEVQDVEFRRSIFVAELHVPDVTHARYNQRVC
jgi:hypothetical protein